MSIAKEISEFLNLGLELGDDEATHFKQVKDAILDKEYLTKEDAKKDKDLSKHFYDKNRVTFKILLEEQFGVDLKDVNGAKEAAVFIKAKVDADIATIKEGQADPSQEVAALTKKYEDALNELGISKSGLESLKTQLSDKDNEFKTTQKSWIRDEKIKQLWASPEIKISETKDKYWLNGFKEELGSKYKFDLDEDNNAIVTDKYGNMLQSTDNVGAKKTPLEVIMSELDTAGGLRKNNVDPKQPTVQVPSVRVDAGDNSRPSHPNSK
jgi:hypothetical protein